jgi:hypothetical protein
MAITIRATFRRDDPDASMAFHRDTLGSEVRNDGTYDGIRSITVGPADQPGTSIVLEPSAADPWGAGFWCRLSISRLAAGLNTTYPTGSM